MSLGSGLSSESSRTYREETIRSYLSTLMGRLERLPFSVPQPIMRRLMEYRASWVRMPARMAGMPQKVWKMPVTSPASMPAASAASSASQVGQPFRVSTTHTAPPVHRDPSTVRSAMSRMRKVMYTPMAIMPQIRPWVTAPGIELSRADMKSITRRLQKV